MLKKKTEHKRTASEGGVVDRTKMVRQGSVIFGRRKSIQIQPTATDLDIQIFGKFDCQNIGVRLGHRAHLEGTDLSETEVHDYNPRGV